MECKGFHSVLGYSIVEMALFILNLSDLSCPIDRGYLEVSSGTVLETNKILW